MTRIPGESPEARSHAAPAVTATGRDAYRRPAIALIIAAITFVVACALVLAYPGLRASFPGPPWLQRVFDFVVLSAPLIVGVALAGRIAASGIARATGIRSWRGIDPVLGVLVALVTRSLAEVLAPKAATLLGPLETGPASSALAGAIVLVAGLVVVSPLVEELFFRGLILRAMEEALTAAGRILAALAALVTSTAAFVLLHALPWGGGAPVGLLVGTLGVGLGCGILTIVTRRLGAAVVAHVTYNAIGVALLLF
jgi:membrane protease YdiL (CAAX protease family)